MKFCIWFAFVVLIFKTTNQFWTLWLSILNTVAFNNSTYNTSLLTDSAWSIIQKWLVTWELDLWPDVMSLCPMLHKIPLQAECNHCHPNSISLLLLSVSRHGCNPIAPVATHTSFGLYNDVIGGWSAIFPGLSTWTELVGMSLSRFNNQLDSCMRNNIPSTSTC